MEEWYTNEENIEITHKQLILKINDDELIFKTVDIYWDTDLYQIIENGHEIFFRYKESDELDFDKIKKNMRNFFYKKFKKSMINFKNEYLKEEKKFNKVFKKEIRLEKLNRIIEDE